MARSRLRRHLFKVIAGLAVLLVAAPVVYLVLILPASEIKGGADLVPTFQYDEAFAIEKTAPGDIKFAVNNSVARFHLDVAAPDTHCRRLFRDYASALEYCRSSRLAWMPSVHLVRGKCRQFDRGLCAALELAVQRGAAVGWLGKRAALTRLAQVLVGQLDEAPSETKRAVERAVVHVAAALDLGGVRLDLPAEIVPKVQAAREEFLADARRSRPAGFWTWSDDLRLLFLQDRFLAGGFHLADDTELAVVLAAAVARDEQLAQAFKRFRDFSARLTNPPAYIDLEKVGAPPAPCVSFADVAALLPADTALADLLRPDTVEKVRKELGQRFGQEAGFAVVSYPRSKEYDLLAALRQGGTSTGAGPAMALIIDALDSGRLSLGPEPDSGWYDYQWYALETMLLPDRGRESVKMILTEAYRARLRSAFGALLTGRREVLIERLPVIGPRTPYEGSGVPRRVDVGPEFSVEPTATVYLRLARGYRFLHKALLAVLGEEALGKLHRQRGTGERVEADLDAELKQMACLMYGLYERVCLEIGQLPRYLDGEVLPEEAARTREVASRWLAALDADPDLAADDRLAVPVADDPAGGVTRYWATGGVKLERVVYKYREAPEVKGAVEPLLVAKCYYLPREIFFEFDRPVDRPAARVPFSEICDRAEDEGSLRKALGAIEPAGGPRRSSYALVIWGLMLVAAAVLAFRFRRHLRAVDYARVLNKRTAKAVRLALGALLCIWVLALAVSPYYRARLLVRYVARVNTHLGLWCERHFRESGSRHHVAALADLLSDPDPQVRYLASRYLGAVWRYADDGERLVTEVEGMAEKLRAAADDDAIEVADFATHMMGFFKSSENVDFLLSKLRASAEVDALCGSAISSLGRIGDPRALDAVLPFTEDPRPVVRRWAIWSLSDYNDTRAVRRLIELVLLPHEHTSRAAWWAMRKVLHEFPGSPWKKEFDAALLKAACNPSFTYGHREGLARVITEAGSKVTAYTSMLEFPSVGKYGGLSDCRRLAANALGRIGPDARAAIPALTQALKDPDADVRKEAAAALQKISEVR